MHFAFCITLVNDIVENTSFCKSVVSCFPCHYLSCLFCPFNRYINAKSYLYIYILHINDLETNSLLVTIFKRAIAHFVNTVKWFQIFLFNASNCIQHYRDKRHQVLRVIINVYLTHVWNSNRFKHSGSEWT